MSRDLAQHLTSGVLDGYARRAFKYGGCGALALALHDATGWPIVAITDHHNVFEDRQAGGGSALHWTVRHPDGRLIDIDGAHDHDELVEAYHGDADDGQAAAGKSCREDVVEWYIECQGEPIPVTLAASFVSPLLEAIRKKDLLASELGEGDALSPEGGALSELWRAPLRRPR